MAAATEENKNVVDHPMADSIDIFNELLLDFVTNLARTYHHVKALQTAPNQIRLAIRANKHSMHQEFMKCLGPFQTDIMERNEELFTKSADTISFLKTADFKTNWTQSSKATQDAIWEYLHNLILIGGSMQALTPSLMSDITTFVDKYAGENQGELNIEHLMASLSQDETMSKIFSDSGVENTHT